VHFGKVNIEVSIIIQNILFEKGLNEDAPRLYEVVSHSLMF